MAAIARILSCSCCKPSKIEPAINIPTFDDGKKKRKCTDIPFLAAFGLWWVGNMVILAVALPGSEPYSLLYGRDYRGVVCGSKNSVCNREVIGACTACEELDDAACGAAKSEAECTSYAGTWEDAAAGTGTPADPAYLRAPEKGTCGKYTAYPRIDRDVETGIEAGLHPVDDFNEFEFYGVCVHECPRSSTFVCNYDYEQKMKHEFSLSGGRVPAKEPYQTVDEDGNTAADWEPAPGEPSIYGGSRGEFLKHCWGALLRAAASSLTASVSGVGNIYEAASNIEKSHTTSGTQEEASKCQEALSECFYVPFDSPSLFFRCVPNKKMDETSEEECIEGIEVDGAQREAIDGGCLKKLVTKTVKTEQATKPNVLMDKFQTFSATAGRYMGDLNRTFYVILIFGGIAIVMGFVWLQLLKRFAGYFVWLTIVLLQASLLFVTLYCWHKAGKFSSPELDALAEQVDDGVASLQVNDPDADPRATAKEDDQKAFEVYASICTVATAIYFVMILLAYKKVKIAVGIIEEASKAVHTMPFIVMWPVVTVTAVFIVFGIWATGAAIIGTAGSIATEDRSGALASMQARRALLAAAGGGPPGGGRAAPYLPVAWSVVPGGERRLDDGGDGAGGGSTAPVVFAKFNADGTFNATAAGLGAAAYKTLESMGGQDVFQVYNLFTFLWTNQFFQGIETMTIAGAIACWYWTLDKGDRGNLAKHPISSALWRAVRYHLGTICFGALIIAIVQMVRIALAYLDRQTKGLQKANFAIKMLMKCAQCCLWCFEKCVKFITNSAYIVCAMYGGGFCASTKKAFKLILKNAARVATLKTISTFLMILGKVVIAATCGFLGFLWIDNDPQYQPPPDGDGEALSSVLLPVVVTTLVAFMVGSAFIGVYSMAIDTIMLCFLEDMAINDGTKEKPFYADGALKKFVEAHSDKVKKRRRKKKGKSKRGKGKKKKGDKKADDKACADAKAGGDTKAP